MSADWKYMYELDGRGFLKDTSELREYRMEDYVHPDDLELGRKTIEEAIRNKTVFELEHRVVRADGSYGWTYSRAVPLLGPDGEIQEWIGTAVDTTDRKQAEAAILRINADLEQRVEERTAELTSANRELEAFTFATSHDLRGPLGRINSFATLLERNCRDILGGNNLLFLDMIRQNATRLTQLVEDLLAHARISQHTLELRPLDISAVAQTIVQDKASEAREASAEIYLSLPPVRVLADSQALEQVLGNLVENAIKYSSRVPSPVVELSGEAVGGRFRLWVKDNGIGFDMKYHDKIFKMFQRLHTYTEYQGSGVGLALVSRAVERMGGKIWAKSEPGNGAAFYLELQVATEEGST